MSGIAFKAIDSICNVVLDCIYLPDITKSIGLKLYSQVSAWKILS